MGLSKTRDCIFCGKTFSNTGIRRHVEACKENPNRKEKPKMLKGKFVFYNGCDCVLNEEPFTVEKEEDITPLFEQFVDGMVLNFGDYIRIVEDNE